MGFLTSKQIQKMGFGSVGDNVLLSDKASYYNCQNINIEDNVRVDDFCILSAGVGGISIGNYVHIAAFSTLIGDGKIRFDDFSGASSRVAIYSSSDDYSGAVLTNPTVPQEFSAVQSAEVLIGRHVIIGVGSVILPGVTLAEGAAVGAMSLVTKSCDSFSVYFGIPARKIKQRKRDLLVLEEALLTKNNR